MLNKRLEQNKDFISKTICSSLIKIQIKNGNRKGIKKPYVVQFIENIIAIIFISFLITLLYFYKTRGLAKRGRFAKSSSTYFWFQIGLLVLLFIWSPWKE